MRPSNVLWALGLLVGLGCSKGEDSPNDSMLPPPGVGSTPPVTMGSGGGAAAQPGTGNPTPGEPGPVGGMPNDPTQPGGEAPPPGPIGLAPASKEPISADCQAFPLAGLKESPGGDTLPNKCAEFHPTNNNPYAIRCIDAMPGVESGFPGDEYCILPPPADKGVQVGVHPQGNTQTYWQQIFAGDFSGYENPPAGFVVEPGGELTQNYRGSVGNTETFNYYRTYFRMRTGSHHNIITMHSGTQPDGWIAGIGDALPGLFDLGAGPIAGVLGGQQRPDDSTPVTLQKPPEDEGLYLRFPANPKIIFNMHHFNFTDVPVLREGWSNIWYETDNRTLVSWYMGLEPSQVIGLNVAPGGTADLHYAWSVGADTRLVRVFGHRHAWTSNFSSWIERAAGGNELIYQSYDWNDMPTYRYDSVVQNPVLNPDARTDGATSGVLDLKAGDKLHFNCHIEFTAERAATEGAPSPTEVGQLRFANEVYTGEMCIQFGNATASLGLPAIQNTPVPDFAKVDQGDL